MVKYRIVYNGLSYRIEVLTEVKNTKGKYLYTNWIPVDHNGVTTNEFRSGEPCEYNSQEDAEQSACKFFGSTAERYREWRTV